MSALSGSRFYPGPHPGPPALLILPSLGEAGSVNLFLSLTYTHCFLSLLSFSLSLERNLSPGPADSGEMSPAQEACPSQPCLPALPARPTAQLLEAPGSLSFYGPRELVAEPSLPSLSGWGGGRRGEGSQNIESERTGPSTPAPPTGLNKTVCEEMLGVDCPHSTRAREGVECGLLNLLVESFSHEPCLRPRKLF